MIAKGSVGRYKMDYGLTVTVVVLVAIGLIMVYSTTFTMRADSSYYLKRQAVWALLGLVAFVVLSRLDYLRWRKLAIPVMLLSVVGLLVVLALGSVRGGSQSWLVGASVQPTEYAKLGFVIYIAAWLSSKGDKVRQVTYGLIPFAILLGVVTALVMLQPDLGAAVLIVLTAVAMFFIAGAEMSQLLISLVAGVPVLAFIMMQFGHARNRIEVFLDPSVDPDGIGFQIRSILTAVSRGGLLGQGLGQGAQKNTPPYLYHHDAIFSVVGEELGWIGSLAIIALFLFLAYRGLMAAFRAPEPFGVLLSFGITCWVTFQALIHIAVNTASLPYTGITMPFISYGGSSLTASLAAMGILQSVARVGRDRGVQVSAVFAFGRGNRRPRLSRARRR